MTPAGPPGGRAGGDPAARTAIKCVAWDIDNTLLAGVFIESGERQPPADPEMAAVLAELGRRGIVHAIASRNPPAAAVYAAQVTGARFVAAECGWGRKSAAISRILADLGLSADAIAFVDDDPYERAEVSFTLPDVLVLSPEDMADALGWPEFSPAVVTDEAGGAASFTWTGGAGWRPSGSSADPGTTSCVTAGPRSRSPRPPRPTWPGCTSCRSAPISSTRPARARQRPRFG